MKISEIINKIKSYHSGVRNGEKIDEATTRDKVLYGNTNQECTGIVTTISATADVIRKAYELGANLIISHETCFWNRGDFTDWLQEQNNETFLAKKELLDKTGIVVWRDHDYIHSGNPAGDGTFIDGIYTGVMKKLGWENYLICDKARPVLFEIPETTVLKVAIYIKKCFNLNGVKIIGNPNMKVKKVWICGHIMEKNNPQISFAEENNVDLMLPLELIDYTLTAYVRDNSMLLNNKAIISIGHFNIEEPGMEYMCEWLENALGEYIPCTFVQAGDTYEYYV